MAGVGLTPSLAMAAEDIRDLQGETSHEKRASGGRFRLGGALRRDLGQVQIEPLQRAGDVTDRVDGDAGIERRRLQFGVAERTRVMMLLGTASRLGVRRRSAPVRMNR
jgi:hypothetical protein